jgi:hypothetical protein
VVLSGVAALVVPAIDRGKAEGARRERAEREAYVRRTLARLREDQRPRVGSTSARSTTGIVASLTGAITRDARARARAGTVDPPILRTECERALSGRVDPRSGRAVYTCTAVHRDIAEPGEVHATAGYPFVATVDLSRGRFCWCKTNPLPGEHDVRRIPHVRPSRRCAGPLRRIL